MSKKRNKQNADSQQMQAGKASAGGGRWIAVGLLVLGTGVFLYALNQETVSAPAVSHDSASAPPQPAPGQTGKYRYFENPEDAHPLPVTLPPSRFPHPVIANSYAIAKDVRRKHLVFFRPSIGLDN